MGGIFRDGTLWRTLSAVRPVRLRRKASISGGPAVTSVMSSLRRACKEGSACAQSVILPPCNSAQGLWTLPCKQHRKPHLRLAAGALIKGLHRLLRIDIVGTGKHEPHGTQPPIRWAAWEAVERQ